MQDATPHFSTLAVPTVAAGLSALVLIVQFAIAIARGSYAKDGKAKDSGATHAGLRAYVEALGGMQSAALKVLRVVACLVLLSLSIVSLASSNPATWIDFGLCATYAYASILGAVTLSASRWKNLASGHLATVLLVPWAVYIYRDVWPLATYHLVPADGAEGALLWAEVGVLSLAAIVVPLAIPTEYVPYDPEDPMPEPNPEQTASILSMTTFTFLDDVIWKGYRSPHLTMDELPPLCDSDRMKHMSKRSSPYLDPLSKGSSRHVFWGLMRLYKWEYFELIFLLSILVPSSFLTPIASNRLLAYLETRGEGATVRPWVWVLLFFGGLELPSLISSRYMYTVLKVLACAQAVLTQLIFEHALRIRLKADRTDTSAKPSDAASAPPSAPESVGGGSEDREGTSSEATLDAETQSTAESTTAVSSTSQDPPKDSSESKDKDGKVEEGKGTSLTGKINNMISTDINTLESGQSFILVAYYTPLQIALSILFLYVVLGWSAFVGIGTMIAMFFIPGILSKISRTVQVEKMKKSDARVGTISEAMGGVIRMIKLFGWEKRISDRIDGKRQEELRALRNFKIVTLVLNIFNNLIPLASMVVTFATYSLAAKGELTASKVFSSMAVFQNLIVFFRGCTYSIPACIQAKVALDRITDYLHKTELLDTFIDTQETTVVRSAADPQVIGIREATFTWDLESAGAAKPTSDQRNFKLHIDDELVFKRGRINLVIGPTGCGKTSLLMALLGEMHYIPLGPNSYVSLPREGGVAYHAQESWVLNETIRNNILFGSPFEKERYDKVIQQCALERDLSLFEAGDETEVGERGVTLSGGQKARITLARAIYSSADILLLDDVLAALDVHTAQSIVDDCFKGDLVQGRTVILVTHNVALAAPIAEFVVSLGSDGRVKSLGSLTSALEKDAKLSAYVAKEKSQIQKAEDVVIESKPESPEQKPTGKLVVAEEVSEGHVGWSAMKLFLSNTGSGVGLLAFWAVFLAAMLASRCASVLDTFVLSLWARQYEIHHPTEVSVPYYLSLYVGAISLSVVFMTIGYTTYMFGTLRASRIIHKVLVDTILRATLRWLDKTPSSRIIARCTQDISSIDERVASGLYSLVDMTFEIMIKFTAVVTMSPVFAIPGIVISLLGGWIGKVYMKAQLSVKREMSNAKAPVMGHVGAAVTGLVSIRAYDAQEAFRREAYNRVDRYTSAARTYRNLNRWVSIRCELLTSIFSCGLAAYLLYGSHRDASEIGFSLTMAMSFSGMIVWWIRVLNDFQVEANSLERIQQYLVIEQEPQSTDSGVPPAYWPSSGHLRVEKLSARYFEDGPKVLHDISFEVKSGERVGIVGRTGSGKSSLTLALLRCILTEGKVYFDGMPTDTINLDALRSNITIIPQVPELLTGTLRENLDPFGQHDDAVLNDALRSAGLFSLQRDADEGRLTLDSAVASGGGNLSVGQRQIIALARAIVRRSRLLILDEATSAIDYETDTIIQESLRQEVAKDVTLLTIAHRLQTIMDSDKIMVLDAGRIVEFGPPGDLLQNAGGYFRSLVDASGDKEKLHAMASGSSSSSKP